MSECARNTFTGIHVWRDSAVGMACKFCHARKRAVDGQERAYNAAASWTDNAQAALDALIAAGEPFTSEDVTEAIGLPAGHHETNRNNAVGALIGNASREGLIANVGHTPSRSPRSNGATLVKWRGKSHE